jgi:hypothetical protein
MRHESARRTFHTALAIVVLLGAGSALPGGAAPASAQGTTYTVTNTSGNRQVTGSLPWALFRANYATPGHDRIRFAIPGAGPHVIDLGDTLYVNDRVDIDATSQPGYAGVPLVVLRGNPKVASVVLVTDDRPRQVSGSNSRIKGLGMYRYTSNAITVLPSVSGVVIEDNWLGFMRTPNGVLLNRASGLPGARFSRGIGLSSSNNIVRRNVVSGVENGITIGLPTLEGSPYQGNRISHNRIGTNPAGSSATNYRNSGDGIFIGAGAGANQIGPANVVSGNASAGIEIFDRANKGTVVYRNLIGLDITGTRAIGNGEVGILITGGASGNSIGGSWGGNHVAGNRLGGIVLGTDPWGGASGNWVTGNTVGIGTNGRAVGVQDVGIVIGVGSQRNVVQGNTIGGHRTHGVLVGDQTWRSTSGNNVSDNAIGRLTSGTARPNGGHGVFLWNTRSNTVTGNAFGTNSLGNIAQRASSGNVVR